MRKDQDDKGKRVYDSLAGPSSNGGPLRGPLGYAIYNPAVAEALHLLHDSALMGDYALVGLISALMDQHLPEGKASLPVLH